MFTEERGAYGAAMTYLSEGAPRADTVVPLSLGRPGDSPLPISLPLCCALGAEGMNATLSLSDVKEVSSSGDFRFSSGDCGGTW